jgi:hypothetical protein
VQYIHSFSEKCETKQSDCQGGLAFADFFMQTVLFIPLFLPCPPSTNKGRESIASQ